MPKKQAKKKVASKKGANKYEAFTTVIIDRSQISEAPYNPRKISEHKLSKLKKFIKSKEGGLLGPLIWNKRTGNLVGGHQRLTILDALHRGKPYKMTVSAVDQDEHTEVKSNIFLNNPSAMGEWDVDRLQDIAELFPELKFDDDLGFEEEEIDILNIGGFEEDVFADAGADGSDFETGDTGTDPTRFREEKKRSRDKKKKENKDGEGLISRSDFTLTFIFPDSDGKAAFLKKIGQNPKSVRLNSQILEKLAGKK